MQNIELVIFDLDGTLVDTEKDIYISLNLALEQIDLPQISLDTAKKAIGPGPDEFLRYVLGEEKLHRSEDFRNAFRPIYTHRCADNAKAFDGIDSLLTELKRLDIKLAIATNKARTGTDPILKALDIENFFDIVMTRNDVEKPKPEPDMLLIACEKLKINPQHALMLGDTDNDILSARSAGIKSCLALWGYSNEMEKLKILADYSVDEPMHVLRILDNETKENVKDSIFANL